MKENQMKFIWNEKEKKLFDFSPIGFDVLGKYEIAVALETGNTILNSNNFQIIDVRQIKSTVKKVWNQWFPLGERNTSLMVGVFWTAFMTYIFPWCLDIAKVYCAWKIIQGFYSEGKGVDGKGGKSGFSSLIQYGKWYIALSLVPFAVLFIDEVAHKMSTELMSHPINIDK